jgi:tryptophan synthase alpha chain
MSGLVHISSAFDAARREGRPALMPYFTLGFPNQSASVEIVSAIARAGADLIELGIPFSDPLADGPTIQHSTQVALEHDTSVQRCLEMTAQLRASGVSQPLLLMGYYNPILSYGVDRFVAKAAQAGADGLIVPDLPPEEAGELEYHCRAGGLALAFLVAPTSTPERLALVAAHSTGFLYLVSVTGVTGARAQVSTGLEEFIARVRAVTSLPLAVGFGISTPEQASQVGRLAEGVIVGSALIHAAGQSDRPVEAAEAFVQGFKQAISLRTSKEVENQG